MRLIQHGFSGVCIYGGAVTLRVCDIITLTGLENFPSHVYLPSARIQIIRLQGTWIMNFQASCILTDPIDHFLIIQCKSRRWWVLVSKILCSPKFALFDFFIDNLSRFSAQNNLLCHVRLLAASTQFLSLFLSFKLMPTIMAKLVIMKTSHARYHGRSHHAVCLLAAVHINRHHAFFSSLTFLIQLARALFSSLPILPTTLPTTYLQYPSCPQEYPPDLEPMVLRHRTWNQAT